MSISTTHVLVIGAGYAGIMAALRLAGKTRKDAVEVTLVSALDVFIQRPQSVHLLVSQASPEKSIHRMLRGARVTFKQGRVTGLDLKRRTAAVTTPSGSQDFHYDYLVYSLGSGIDRESVPGVGQYAYVVNHHGSRSVTELRQRLIDLTRAGAELSRSTGAEPGRSKGRVVVVGGGATGIEAATEIKEGYPTLQVSLVTDGEFGAFGGKGSKISCARPSRNRVSLSTSAR